MTARAQSKRRRLRSARRSSVARRAQRFAAALLVAIFPVTMTAQSAAQAQPAEPASRPASTAAPASKPSSSASDKHVSASARRRANRIYLAASKLYLNGRFEQALQEYQQAAALDPTDADYGMAAEVARSHAVAALIQTAAKDRLTGNDAGARDALLQAYALDPKNPEVTQHLDELGDEVARAQTPSPYQQAANLPAAIEPLLSAPGVRSFHVREGARQLVQQVFKAYGVDAMLDDSVHNEPVRFDVDDVDFDTAARVLGLATNSFYVPLDAHRVLVARDTREYRTEFTRQQVETVYLSGLTDTEVADVANLARNVFNVQQVASDPAASAITLRAPPETLNAFNADMRSLLEGRDQVMLDVRIIQVAHSSTVNRGILPPQSMTAFNVYAEEQSILNANQSLVQQIISSGLASANDPLAILGILAASGAIPNSLLSGGFATFGGGKTLSALVPGTATLNLNLNSSDSRELDDVELRLGDGEASTLREGTRYPIQTSAYTTPSLPKIPGLTGAGASGSLSSLVGSLASAVPMIPMIQYQDLGLTLKVTPKVMRDNNVALTVDLKIVALSGASIDGNPILNNQAYSGVVTLKEGEAAELASLINKSESQAISGSPGLSQIPGLNNVTDKNLQQNYATLLIVMTPHLVRATQPAGHTPAMIVEKSTTSMY